MKKIEVREIRLTDFKGQSEKKIEFGHRTVVSGKNGCGKTTLADAFMWVFCDKDYSLKSNPDIRPDDGRECLPRVDIDLVIDGKPVSISKYQKRSKSKTGTISLSNEYTVNDMKMGKEKFQNTLKERGFDFANFLPLAHIDIFTGEKDKDARAVLLSMPDKEGEADLTIAKAIPECKDIVAKMEAEAKTVAEVEAGAKEDLKKAETRLKEIKSEIKGKEDLKVDANTAELELQKNALQEQISDLETQIAQAGNERSSKLRAELSDLGVQKYSLESKASDEISSKRTAIQIKINSLQSERNIISSSLNAKTSELEATREKHKDLEKKQKEAQKHYMETQAKYNNAIDSAESENFKENDTICPTCGQTLPTEQIEKLKEEFELKKQNRIVNLKEQKKQELKSIEVTGNKIFADKNESKESGDYLEIKVTKLTDELEQIKTSLDTENKNLGAIPKEPDFSENVEYQKILASIKEKQQELNSLDDGEEAKKQLSEQLSGKKQELAAVNQKIGEANNNVRIDEQIAELEASRNEYSQKKADAQMILDELKSLSMAKNTALEDAVNQYFNGVKVKLFDTQKNGEVVDACIWYAQDKDGDWKKLIGNANTALMMKGKIAIMDGLQKFYGVSYPIFVDCAAELDNSSLAGIKADAQLIFLKVAEGDMTVTEI